MPVALLSAACCLLPAVASAQAVPPAQAVPQAPGPMVIAHAWARATSDLAHTGAAYLTITSPAADALVGAASPAAKTVAVHQTSEVDGVMQMRPVPSLAIPANTPVTLAPGGYHAMLMGLTKPLHVGDHFPLTLRFQRFGAVTTDVVVEPAGVSGIVMDHGGKQP